MTNDDRKNAEAQRARRNAKINDEARMTNDEWRAGAKGAEYAKRDGEKAQRPDTQAYKVEGQASW